MRFTEMVGQRSRVSQQTGHAKLLLSMPYPHGSTKKRVSLTWPYSLTTEIHADPVTTSPSTVAEYSSSSILSQNQSQQSTMYQMSHLEDRSHQ